MLDAEIAKAMEAYAARRVAALTKELDIENTANFAISAEIEQMRKRAEKADSKLQRFEALDQHLPEGFAIGDDATAQLAIELVQVESDLAEARREIQQMREALTVAIVPLGALVVSGECVAARTALSDDLKQAIHNAHNDVLAALRGVSEEEGK